MMGNPKKFIMKKLTISVVLAAILTFGCSKNNESEQIQITDEILLPQNVIGNTLDDVTKYVGLYKPEKVDTVQYTNGTYFEYSFNFNSNYRLVRIREENIVNHCYVQYSAESATDLLDEVYLSVSTNEEFVFIDREIINSGYKYYYDYRGYNVILVLTGTFSYFVIDL